MRHSCLFVLLMLTSLAAFAAEREDGGIFCYDQAELYSWRNDISLVVRKLFVESPTIAPAIQHYEAALAAASKGQPSGRGAK